MLYSRKINAALYTKGVIHRLDNLLHVISFILGRATPENPKKIYGLHITRLLPYDYDVAIV